MQVQRLQNRRDFDKFSTVQKGREEHRGVAGADPAQPGRPRWGLCAFTTSMMVAPEWETRSLIQPFTEYLLQAQAVLGLGIGQRQALTIRGWKHPKQATKISKTTSEAPKDSQDKKME